ncbi:hypothetical protein [Bacillus pumilus]|uniref:hypothetical protein n=1 Tax=Bacillus pumilus TaxID=1408 RepID=UPI002FFF8200
MKTKMALKLSELPNDFEISHSETNDVFTVKEIKEEIMSSEENQDYEEYDWFEIKRKKWEPNASDMLKLYIESEAKCLPEDWAERANDCLTQEVIEKIQSVLDIAFKEKSVTSYPTYERPVEIDVTNKQ